MYKQAWLGLRVRATCEACGVQFSYTQLLKEGGGGLSNPEGAVMSRFARGEYGIRRCPRCDYLQSWMCDQWDESPRSLFGLIKPNANWFKKHGHQSFRPIPPTVTFDKDINFALFPNTRAKIIIDGTSSAAPFDPSTRAPLQASKRPGCLKSLFLAWCGAGMIWSLTATLCALVLSHFVGMPPESDTFGAVLLLVSCPIALVAFILLYRLDQKRRKMNQGAQEVQPNNAIENDKE